MVNLKAMRALKYMTQEALAEKVGVCLATIAMIETGKNKPSVNVAKRIAEVLEFDWTLFYED